VVSAIGLRLLVHGTRRSIGDQQRAVLGWVSRLTPQELQACKSQAH